jgi:Tol biopolymer transport system component
MNSSLLRRLLPALAVAAVLPACGNLNNGHVAVPFTVRASESTAGLQGNLESAQARLSGNGRYVVFTSAADNLAPLVVSGIHNIFRHDLQTGVTELVSIGVGGVPTDGESFLPSVSFDGLRIAFQSSATNLTAASPVDQQIYVRDMTATVGNGISMVSEASPGVPGTGASSEPAISSDGNFVAFASMATNFGDTHANGVTNIYRRDLSSSAILLISISTALGDPSPGGFDVAGSSAPSISADGSRIAYVSDCTDLVAGDLNDIKDVFVAIVTPVTFAIETRLASPSFYFGGSAQGFSTSPSLSSDGLFVAYQSDAYDLVALDTNSSTPDIFRFDVELLTVQLVSVNAQGFQGPPAFDSESPSISSDGRFVAFASVVENLVEGDTNQSKDIFIKDLVTGAIFRVSVDTSGNPSGPNKNSNSPSLSADGAVVAFSSGATFVKGDTNGVDDVYVRSPLR